MIKKSIISIYRFYYDGFREMTLGRTLWAIILIKLFVMFFILKLFFFPSFSERQEYGREARLCGNGTDRPGCRRKSAYRLI